MSFNGSERVYLVSLNGQDFIVRGAMTAQRAVNVVVRHTSKNSVVRRIGAMDVLEMASKGIIPNIIDVDSSENQEEQGEEKNADQDGVEAENQIEVVTPVAQEQVVHEPVAHEPVVQEQPHVYHGLDRPVQNETVLMGKTLLCAGL